MTRRFDWTTEHVANTEGEAGLETCSVCHQIGVVWDDILRWACTVCGSARKLPIGDFSKRRRKRRADTDGAGG
jgi:hypothetical protein